MEVILKKIEPIPVRMGFADLPKRGWRKPRHLSLRSDQVALSANGQRVEFHASGGEHTIDLELRPDMYALVVSREIDLSLDLPECQFANGTGRLTLWASARFLSPTADPALHPIVQGITGVLDENTFREALEHCLSKGLAKPLNEILHQTSYESGSRRLMCISEALSGFVRRSDVQKTLLSDAGLELVRDIEPLEAACSRQDEAHDRQEAARRWREDERHAAEKKLTEMNMAEAVKRAKSQVQVQEILDEAEREKAELVRRRIVLDGQLEAHRAQVSMETEELRLALQHKAVEKAEQEVELVRARINAKRQSQEAVTRLLTGQQALQEQIDQFAHLIKALSHKASSPWEIERPLALVATWRAYRRTQTDNSMPVLFRPAIQNGTRLPSGTWLDLSATVSHDAYIYVLVKSSNGLWQCLVPDADRIMGGLTRPNRQPANQQVVWPGTNSNAVPAGHENIPYWRLDDAVGWEHVLVAASVTEIDIKGLLNQDETLQDLRSRGVPLLSRGFASGGSIRRSRVPVAIGPDMRETRNCLVGDGCVVDEIVIEHY
ncbi:MAG: hypothetical protein KBE65_20695 [Phycisphaerae bacterium]|nr:hypothetical protein [Phycisphaerae bacterium]